MKHYESIIIGHITLDHNVDHLGNAVDVVGGAVNFSSASAYALGHKVAAVTRLNEKDFDRDYIARMDGDDISLPTRSAESAAARA